MNLDTVLMCAQATARQQVAALGCVGADVQELLDELAPAPVVEEAPAAVETPVEEAPVEAPMAEEAPVEAAPAAE
jgi:hypothetical protein